MKRIAKTGFTASTLGRTLLMYGAVLLAVQPLTGRAAERERADAVGVTASGTPGSSESLRAAAAYSERHGGSALVVMSRGEVIFEQYAGGAGPQEPHRLASGTKSFWGVLAMAAVEDGLLTLDEIAADTLTEWRSDPNKSRIRVRHLLDFTSGLDPAVSLLQGNPKSDDKFKLALRVPSVDAPGNTFAYGPSHLFAFGALLQRKLQAAGRPGDPVAYLKQRILDPIGMRVGRWTEDAAGNPIMPTGAFVAPREWVKFGELLNKRGSWKGRRIVAAGLISQVFEGSRANPAYGLTLWLNQDGRGGQSHLVADGRASQRASKSDDGFIYREGPRDLAMAAGAGKQRLYVIPSRDLVIARQAESKGSGWSDDEFLALVLAGTGSAAAAPTPALAPASPTTDDWRTACAVEIQRFCQAAEGHDRRLWRCLRGHNDELSPGCIAAARAARRGSD